MSHKKELLLVRHCQSTGQHSDASLTESGFNQSRLLAEFLADYQIDYVVASEFLRARQSISPFADQIGLNIHIEARLNERTLSTKSVANWKDIVRRSFDDHDLSGPGGESARDVLNRAWSVLNDILSQNHELPLVVTHGNLLALVMHSIDSTFGYAGWMSLTNPDVYLLREDEHGQMRFERVWSNFL